MVMWLCGVQINVSFDNVCPFRNSATGDLVKYHMCKVAETASPPSPSWPRPFTAESAAGIGAKPGEGRGDMGGSGTFTLVK